MWWKHHIDYVEQKYDGCVPIANFFNSFVLYKLIPIPIYQYIILNKESLWEWESLLNTNSASEKY